jgi:ABC-2 type transport system permease protein
MNKILLRLLRLFDGFWRRIDVNPDHLHTILEVKLKMDGRRKTAFNYHRSAQKKEVKGQDIIAMISMFFLGTFSTFIIFYLDHSPSAIFLYLTLWMAILSLTLISDFTDVLIDVRDNFILLPRPIEGRTIAFSRILHILFYLVKLVIPFCISGFIGVGIKFGPLASVLLGFLIILSVLLTIFIVNILYLILLNVLSPSKFKEVINYFQIAFFALMFVGYQLLPRLIIMNGAAGSNFIDRFYFYPLPSTWLANIWGVFYNESSNTAINYSLALLGLAAPFLAIYLVATVLSKNFSQKVFSIAEGESTTSRTKNRRSKAGAWMRYTGIWVCRNSAERSIYEFTWQLSGRSRDFKLRFYPSIIMIPILFITTIILPMGGEDDTSPNLYNSSFYLFGFYFSIFLLISALSVLPYAERYKASWFYRAYPIESPGRILTGSYKALLVKYFLPIYAIITVATVYLFGMRVLNDAFFALFALLTTVTGVAMLTNNILPFTKSWDEASRGGNIGFLLLSMMLASACAAIHYFISQYDWLVWLMIPLLALLHIVGIRHYASTKWKYIIWE